MILYVCDIHVIVIGLYSGLVPESDANMAKQFTTTTTNPDWTQLYAAVCLVRSISRGD